MTRNPSRKSDLLAAGDPGDDTMAVLFCRPVLSGGSAMPNQIVVHNPVGYPPKVSGKSLAPRVDSLDGKTVYLVDCRFDDSDIFLKQMQGWFADHMPSVKTVYKPISNVYTQDDPATWEEVKARGDAA